MAQITADLDSVTVTASRITTDISESGKSVSVYTADDIRKLPVTSVDDLLRYLPGINLNSRGGFGVQSDVGIRGTTFSQVLFFLIPHRPTILLPAITTPKNPSPPPNSGSSTERV